MSLLQNTLLKAKSTAPVVVQKPLMLANGIKLHVQPQNLLLAANLANLSHTKPSTLASGTPLMNHSTTLQKNGVGIG